jgi:hypothetical protein
MPAQLSLPGQKPPLVTQALVWHWRQSMAGSTPNGEAGDEGRFPASTITRGQEGDDGNFRPVVIYQEAGTPSQQHPSSNREGLPGLLEKFRNEMASASCSDSSNIDRVLKNQVTALDRLFLRLVEQALGCENVSDFEAHMKIALRAQGQCRATLETLACIDRMKIESNKNQDGTKILLDEQDENA